MPSFVVREPGCVPFSADVPPETQTFDIGREAENALVLSDRQVSRKHARVSAHAGAVHIADLSSTHGIFVNGRRVSEAVLSDGDVVQVGNALLAFRVNAEEPSGEPVYRAALETAPSAAKDPEARRLRLLYEASQVIGAVKDPDEVVGRMLEATLGVLGCQHGVVGLAEAGAAARRISRGDELVVSRAHIEAMLARRECVFVPDARAAHAPPTLRRSRARSAVGAPLLSGGRTLGFLYLDDRGRGAPFVASDAEFVTALAHLIAAALAQAEEERRSADLVAALRAGQPTADILGDSPPVRKLRDELAKYARAASAPVLILGETGSGKELVAWHIHALSARAEEPFVAVNCAAIPDTLVESELFGHEKGAFTGALKARRGKFAIAHRGTLFLDEIGDLSLPAQAKVLRAIEEGEILPVGAELPVRVDVRVLSATHRRLTEEVAAGRFREDLYYRLAVGEVAVPPLRARGDDVVVLAESFLARTAARQRRRLSFGPEAKAALRRYDWPGNVRQLANEVERAAILADGPVIERLDLRARGAAAASPAPVAGADGDGDWQELTRRREELDAAERRIIEGVLQKHGGVVARAARELGLPRTSLVSRIEALGIVAPRT